MARRHSKIPGRVWRLCSQHFGATGSYDGKRLADATAEDVASSTREREKAPIRPV